MLGNLGIMNAVRNGPIAGVLDTLNVPVLSNLEKFRVGEFLAAPGERAFNLLGENGGILDGGLLGGLPRLGLLNEGSIALPYHVKQVRNLFINSLERATSLPARSVGILVDLAENLSLPLTLPGVYVDGAREFMQANQILNLFANLETRKLALLREVIGSLGFNGDGMIGSAFDFGILGGIRDQLFNSDLVEGGPLADLRGPARAYLGDLLPLIGSIGQVDKAISRVTGELNPVLGGDISPGVVARMMDLKLNMIGDVAGLTRGIAVNMAEIGTEIIQFGVRVGPLMAELALKLPSITIDALFTLMSMVEPVIEGVITLKVAALSFMVTVPLEMVSAVVAAPVSVFKQAFSEIESTKLGVLSNIFGEVGGLFNMYEDYTGVLGLGPGILPLSDFARQSRSYLQSGVDLLVPCEGDQCFTE